MQSAVWVQELMIVGACKLKTEIAFCMQTTCVLNPGAAFTQVSAGLCRGSSREPLVLSGCTEEL